MARSNAHSVHTESRQRVQRAGGGGNAVARHSAGYGNQNEYMSAMQRRAKKQVTLRRTRKKCRQDLACRSRCVCASR